MDATTADMLRQYMDRSKQRHESSFAGQYEQKLKTGENRGMIDLGAVQQNPVRANYGNEVYFKTPQQSSGGGGMSVICTLMHEYGYIDDDIFAIDTLYGKMLLANDPSVIIGYHYWAKPLVKFIRNNAIYLPLFSYIAVAWALEMVSEFGLDKKRSTFQKLVGKIAMNLGKPLCRFIGNSILSTQGGYEYHRS